MTQPQSSELGNNSYSFFGPIGMAFYEDGNALDEADSVKIVLSIILGIIMVLSIVGNGCTCAVIARDRTMRTPTNCYLFNLAITDLLFALFIPIEIYIIWCPDLYPLGEAGCLLHFLLYDCLCNCSALTISAFTIERYLVVSKPFLRQKLSLKSRVFKILCIIWTISFSFCIPDLFNIDLLEKKKYVYCYVTMSYPMKVLLGVEQFVFFVMPMTVIFVLYVLIAIKLKKANLKLRNSPVNGKQHRDKAVKMLAAVAASFFFCWSPYCLLRIMVIHSEFKYEDYYIAWRIVNYMCYSSYLCSVINPILYSLMSHKFRQAFKDFLKGRSRTQIDSKRRDSSGPWSKTERTGA
ncbi:pyrokinin-1 receptor-like [Ostrinia nubilalis]|uniref:pyrokinin-1 receptor-like n=1 Tax=Ostrinia nubilalis TaxID=29057 RepID=UPI00308227AA